MVLVLHPVQILQVGAHLAGGLGDLGHLDMLKLVEAENGLGHLVVEQGVATRALKLRQDAHAVARDGLGALHLQ